MSNASSDPTQSFLSKSDQRNDSNEAHICIDTVSHGIKGSLVRGRLSPGLYAKCTQWHYCVQCARSSMAGCAANARRLNASNASMARWPDAHMPSTRYSPRGLRGRALSVMASDGQ